MWYNATNKHSLFDQGLVIDDQTGENIAVTFKAENAALIAAAPETAAERDALKAQNAELLHIIFLMTTPLERIVNGNKGTMTSELSRDALDIARAALAKVKG